MKDLSKGHLSCKILASQTWAKVKQRNATTLACHQGPQLMTAKSKAKVPQGYKPDLVFKHNCYTKLDNQVGKEIL